MPEPQDRNKSISKRVGRNVFEKPPKISVVIPAYNSAEYISETLASVIAQKFREHEIIVVNDGSPDTEQFERSIRNRIEDIVYIKQKNAGAGIARNTAIEAARGEIIAFLDADDVWLPDFLSSQFVFLNRNSYDMVYCDAILFGMNSAYRRTFMETAPSRGEANFESILDLRMQCHNLGHDGAQTGDNRCRDVRDQTGAGSRLSSMAADGQEWCKDRLSAKAAC